MASQDEYRPTEYMQAWAEIFFDEQRRLAGAKTLQRSRCDFIEAVYPKIEMAAGITPPLDRYREGIERATTNSELLSAEADFTKRMYALLAKHYQFDGFTRRHGLEDQGDLANSYLDYGNYLAYGIAASCLHALGISYAFPLNHGKTRRGALIFDIADLIKDGLVMPTAFFSAYSGEVDKDFRERLLKVLRRHKASDFMFSTIKDICQKG